MYYEPIEFPNRLKFDIIVIESIYVTSRARVKVCLCNESSLSLVRGVVVCIVC